MAIARLTVFLTILTVISSGACSPTCPDGFELDPDEEFCRRISDTAVDDADKQPHTSGNGG